MKELITASPEASHKSYCDDELTETSVKKKDLEIQVAAHSTKLETAISKTSALDGEVAQLHAVLKKMQAELTQDAARRPGDHGQLRIADVSQTARKRRSPELQLRNRSSM